MTRRPNGEGSVWFDPERNKWTARLRLPNGSRPTFRGDTEAEVRLELKKAAVDVARGLPIASNKLTLKRYLAEWIAAARLDRERRPNTLKGYATNIQHISTSSIGKLRLGKVQPRDVQTLLRELRARGLSERTVTYIHATLRVALGDAVELDELPRNPAQVSRRKGRKRGAQADTFKVQPLSKAHIGRLLDAARGERLEALFYLAVMCGLRRSELLGLRWQDVDLSRRQLRVVNQLAESHDAHGQRTLELVPVKTDGSARFVDLPDGVVDHLHAHRARQDQERASAHNLWLYRDLVFCSDLGAGVETTTLYRIYARIRERAGIHARLHDLRHTAASLMLAQGVPLWDVSKILGHASYQFTLDTYGHLYAEPRRTAADAMDAVLRELHGT